MKTITYLAAFTFAVGSVAMTAQNRVMETDRGRTVNHTIQAEPIVFMERGIEFFVFLNGDFDFNTRPNDSHGGIFYRRGGTRGTTAVNVNYGVRIEHDSFGRVRRVGNTFINYDFRNRVSRIGSIFMNYNRFGLSRIGGMEIVYNRRGIIVDMLGHVNGWRGNNSWANNTYYGSSNNYYGNDEGYAYNENDYYYYKADGTKALIEDKKEK